MKMFFSRGLRTGGGGLFSLNGAKHWERNFMAKKTLKLVDPNDPASAISPPRPLGKHGRFCGKAS